MRIKNKPESRKTQSVTLSKVLFNYICNLASPSSGHFTEINTIISKSLFEQSINVRSSEMNYFIIY